MQNVLGCINHRYPEQVHIIIIVNCACSNPKTDRIGKRHTVKAGHYIVLAAIPSKFIWTPKQETKETSKKREGVSLYKGCVKPTTVITGVKGKAS